MDSDRKDHADYHAALDALRWQVEMGADEAISDAPVDRFALPAKALPAKAPVRKPETRAAPARPEPPAAADPVAVARAAAAGAGDLAALKAALEAFDLCDLKKGARHTVFADGDPAARVMVVGEAPGRDEDREGRPFVGRAGKLLDRMLAAIGLARDAPDAEHAVYITNVLPWRPPQNREPTPAEIAMLVPFLERHIELVAPEILIAMGNTPCQALLGRRGITRLRGTWADWHGLAVMPMFHPAYLLRNPAAKREAWADLLEIQARLNA